VARLGCLRRPALAGKIGLYEPCARIGPRYRRKGIANPLGAILSVAMMLRHSFQLEKERRNVESAVAAVPKSGLRTRDLSRPAKETVTTQKWAGDWRDKYKFLTAIPHVGTRPGRAAE